MTQTDAVNRRQQLIDDLRSLATYLEEHGQVPIPRYRGLELQLSALHDSEATSEREAIAEVARIAGLLEVPITVEFGHHVAERRLGLVTYRAVAIERQVMQAHDALNSYRSNFCPDDDEGAAR